MNRSTRVARGRAARTVVAIFAGAIFVLPAAASGRSSQSSNTQMAIAYSHCMRSHGVPRYPDPGRSGAIPKVSLQRLGVSLTRWEAAQAACAHLLPNGGGGSTQAQLQQWMNGMRSFAQCMRSDGVSNWPDPVFDAGGNPEFYLDGKVNQNAPQIKTKIQGCLHFLPSFAISPGSPVACSGANPGPSPLPGCGGCGCTRRA